MNIALAIILGIVIAALAYLLFMPLPTLIGAIVSGCVGALIAIAAITAYKVF